MAHRDVRQQQMDLSITMLGSQEALALIFKRYVFRTSECLDQDWLCVCQPILQMYWPVAIIVHVRKANQTFFKQPLINWAVSKPFDPLSLYCTGWLVRSLTMDDDNPQIPSSTIPYAKPLTGVLNTAKAPINFVAGINMQHCWVTKQSCSDHVRMVKFGGNSKMCSANWFQHPMVRLQKLMQHFADFLEKCWPKKNAS